MFSLLLLFALSMGFGQGDSPEELHPNVLVASSSRDLPMPGFSAYDNVQCDSKANLYFHTGFRFRDSVIMKLASTDGAATIFRPRSIDASQTYFLAFNVTPDGNIALLAGTNSGTGEDEPYVYEFNGEDPANVTGIHLEAPEGLHALTVRNFVVLSNGHLLLQGYFDEKAPPKRRGHGYVAEFSPSGKLMRISLEQASDDLLKEVAAHGANTASAQGSDGFIYLLEPERLLAISPKGRLNRTIKLKPPSGYFPFQLYMHERELIVGFSHSDGNGSPLKTLYALVDAETGENIRLYRPGPDLGNNMVCLSDEGLMFLTNHQGHLRLIDAPLK